MAVHPIDSLLGRATFGDDVGREIWSDRNTIRNELRVWAALAQAQAELGLIPDWAAAEIRDKANIRHLDLDKISTEIAHTQHGLVPVINAYSKFLGEAGKYLHWGATTDNIGHTTRNLKLRETNDVIIDRLFDIINSLSNLATKHRNTVMAGRTHGQHALPITFGFKAAVWISELGRHIDRLESCGKRSFIAVYGGGTGTLASVGPIGLSVLERMGELLEMESAEIPDRTAHDRLAEYMCLIGMLAATCEKIAEEIAMLQRTEFSELEEPFHMGKVGSSTMPQKRNPITCCNVIGAARIIRSNVSLALEAMIQANEGDVATSIPEGAFVTENCVLILGVLSRLQFVLKGLTIKPEAMAENLTRSHGLIVAEAVMMELADFVGRQEAHEIVYEAAMKSVEEKISFREALLENRDVQELGEAKIDQLLNPANYIGAAPELVDKVLANARQRAEQRTKK